jgi:hypothetical protein
MCGLILTLFLILGGILLFLAVRWLLIVAVGALVVSLVLLFSPETTRVGRYLGAILLAVEALGLYLYLH